MGRSTRRWLLAATALMGVAAVRWRPFRVAVEGTSMAPGLEPGQFLIAVRSRRIDRKDVVVVRPKSQPEMVKRVVGMPGERVEVDDGRVQVGNRLLREPYASGRGADGSWQLGPDEYVVLGDDRDHSTDSRSFGPVRREHIAGLVWFRYWPRAGRVG